MKKLAVILIIISISLSTFAKGHVMGRRYVASIDNKQVIQSQKDQKAAVRNFATGRRYSSVTHGHGLHLFGRRGAGAGASKPESGLGL